MPNDQLCYKIVCSTLLLLDGPQVLSDHIARLGAVITPGHHDLKIPRQYHYEQPWPSAQAEIRRLAAYKTASDKVACVVR